MNGLEVLRFSLDDRDKMREEFLKLDSMVPLLSKPELTARVTVYGMSREIGTVNDEIARFVFDAETGEPVKRESLHAEIVKWKNMIGLRVQARGYRRLEPRAHGLRALIHPGFSENRDGTLHSLTIFPEICARIASLQGIELVLPRAWALNSVFGGFDPSAAYYQTNFWELENNDTVHFAAMIEQRRLALLGTHDLIAHVAGLKADAWDQLVVDAKRTRVAVENYLRFEPTPSIAPLVLPYTAGVVLDDLAQPPSYGSASHRRMLNVLIQTLESENSSCGRASVLLRFPEAFEKVIRLSRRQEADQTAAKQAVGELVEELRSASVVQMDTVLSGFKERKLGLREATHGR